MSLETPVNSFLRTVYAHYGSFIHILSVFSWVLFPIFHVDIFVYKRNPVSFLLIIEREN